MQPTLKSPIGFWETKLSLNILKSCSILLVKITTQNAQKILLLSKEEIQSVLIVLLKSQSLI
jgi:hypothetical protein